MTIECDSAPNQKEDVSSNPDTDARAARLNCLFDQLERYPKCNLSASEMLLGIYEMYDAILLFWSPKKAEHRQRKWLPRVIKAAQQHLNFRRISHNSKKASTLLGDIRSILSTTSNLERDHAAVMAFKLGFLFAKLDHETEEKEAAAQSRVELSQAQARNGPSSAEKRTWWKSHARHHLENFTKEYPNIKNARFVAQEIFPLINNEKRKHSSFTLNSLAREVRLFLNGETTKT